MSEGKELYDYWEVMNFMKGRVMRQDEMAYSKRIKGSPGNYGWAARFDITGRGYLGISQFNEDGRVQDRVLLSPAQVRAMIKFLGDSAP